MSIFYLKNYEIHFNDSFDFYNGYHKDFYALINEIFTEFDTNFYQTFRSAEDLVKNVDSVAAKHLKKLLNKAIDILVQNNIYDCSEDKFYKDYYDFCFDFSRYSDLVRDRYNRIKGIEAEIKVHRTVERASRSRWQGGGFGLGGAIKGAMTAGALNMATGAARSVGDSMTNASDHLEIKKQLSKLYKDPDIKGVLSAGIAICGTEIFNAVVLELEKHTGIKFVLNTEKADAIFSNVKSRVVNEAQALELMKQAIENNPYNGEYYTYLLERMGDNDQQVIKLAKYVGEEYSVEKYRVSKLPDLMRGSLKMNYTRSQEVEEAIDNYIRIGREYGWLDEWNQVRTAREKMFPQETKTFKAYKTILEDKRKKMLVVDGITLSSPKEADDYRDDLDELNELIISRDPRAYYEVEECKRFIDVIDKKTFRTSKIQDKVNEIRNKKAILEAYEKSLFYTFAETFKKLCPVEEKSDIFIYGQEKFWEKAKQIDSKKIVSTKEDYPIPLLIIDTSSKGNFNQGILLTAHYLYSFGLIGESAIGVENIKEIALVNNNPQSIRVEGDGKLKIKLPPSISGEEFLKLLERSLEPIRTSFSEKAHVLNESTEECIKTDTAQKNHFGTDEGNKRNGKGVTFSIHTRGKIMIGLIFILGLVIIVKIVPTLVSSKNNKHIEISTEIPQIQTEINSMENIVESEANETSSKSETNSPIVELKDWIGKYAADDGQTIEVISANEEGVYLSATNYSEDGVNTVTQNLTYTNAEKTQVSYSEYYEGKLINETVYMLKPGGIEVKILPAGGWGDGMYYRQQEKEASNDLSNERDILEVKSDVPHDNDQEGMEEYLLPDVDKRYYTKEELMLLPKEKLRLARNEVFARHHRKYETQDLREYFESKSWYDGYLSAEEFDDSVLNGYEKANLDLIKVVEGIENSTESTSSLESQESAENILMDTWIKPGEYMAIKEILIIKKIEGDKVVLDLDAYWVKTGKELHEKDIAGSYNSFNNQIEFETDNVTGALQLYGDDSLEGSLNFHIDDLFIEYRDYVYLEKES